MLNSTNLIQVYRQEKKEFGDTILDTIFPSFKVWKKEYIKEWNISHEGSSFIDVDLALEITEAEIGSLHLC